MSFWLIFFFFPFIPFRHVPFFGNYCVLCILIEFLIDSCSLMTCTAVCMDACTSMGLRVLPWPRYHATHPPWTLLNRVLGFFPPPISLSFSSSSHHFLRSARRHEGCSSTEAEGRLFTGDAPPSCAADAARSPSAVPRRAPATREASLH